jgi:S1-C subfamily serine protease
VAAEEGFDDDGPEFRAPLPPEDRVWRHPAEMGSFSSAAALDAEARSHRNPWAVGFFSIIGGVLLAGSLMFGAGGVGDEPGRIALRPIATLAPRTDDNNILIASLDVPTPPTSLVGIDVHAGDEVRIGNGLAVESPGYVVTTASLVAGADDIRVTDPRGVVHDAVVVDVDELNELAVIRTEDLVLPPASLDAAATAAAGDEVYIVGASRGVAGSRIPATIASTDARLSTGSCDLHGVMRLDESVDVSAAGALVVDAKGRTLGLVTTLAEDEPVVVPVRTVSWVARQILSGSALQHGWLGVEGETAPTDGTDPNGALVNRVLDASPAQAAGLAPNDVVVAVDGDPVTTMGSLVVAVRESAPGSTVTVSVMREGARQELPVTLTTAPPIDGD